MLPDVRWVGFPPTHNCCTKTSRRAVTMCSPFILGCFYSLPKNSNVNTALEQKLKVLLHVPMEDVNDTFQIFGIVKKNEK